MLLGWFSFLTIERDHNTAPLGEFRQTFSDRRPKPRGASIWFRIIRHPHNSPFHTGKHVDANA